VPFIWPAGYPTEQLPAVALTSLLGFVVGLSNELIECCDVRLCLMSTLLVPGSVAWLCEKSVAENNLGADANRDHLKSNDTDPIPAREHFVCGARH